MDYCWHAPGLEGAPTADQEQAPDGVIDGWARALDARAQLPDGFSGRTASLATRLAAAVGLEGQSLQDIRRGALLHDIGMMHVPDGILRKPGPLTPGEWAVVRMHPLFADETLGPVTSLRAMTPIPRFHHERWDGAGYPYGLCREQIPLPARIFAIADAWAIMTVDRPYRRALAPEQALKIIAEGAGAQFDPALVASFLALLDQRVPTP